MYLRSSGVGLQSRPPLAGTAAGDVVCAVLCRTYLSELAYPLPAPGSQLTAPPPPSPLPAQRRSADRSRAIMRMEIATVAAVT